MGIISRMLDDIKASGLESMNRSQMGNYVRNFLCETYGYDLAGAGPLGDPKIGKKGRYFDTQSIMLELRAITFIAKEVVLTKKMKSEALLQHYEESRFGPGRELPISKFLNGETKVDHNLFVKRFDEKLSKNTSLLLQLTNFQTQSLELLRKSLCPADKKITFNATQTDAEKANSLFDTLDNQFTQACEHYIALVKETRKNPIIQENMKPCFTDWHMMLRASRAAENDDKTSRPQLINELFRRQRSFSTKLDKPIFEYICNKKVSTKVDRMEIKLLMAYFANCEILPVMKNYHETLIQKTKLFAERFISWVENADINTTVPDIEQLYIKFLKFTNPSAQTITDKKSKTYLVDMLNSVNIKDYLLLLDVIDSLPWNQQSKLTCEKIEALAIVICNRAKSGTRPELALSLIGEVFKTEPVKIIPASQKAAIETITINRMDQKQLYNRVTQIQLLKEQFFNAHQAHRISSCCLPFFATWFTRTKLSKNESLKELIEHAKTGRTFFGGRNRTYHVMRDLNWMNQEGKVVNDDIKRILSTDQINEVKPDSHKLKI